MSGRCPDNFWIENGIIGNMNKLGNIAWDYGIFLHGSEVYVGGNHMVSWWNLFQAIIVVVAFGGIDERVLECSNGINVRPAKQGSMQKVALVVERDSDGPTVFAGGEVDATKAQREKNEPASN